MRSGKILAILALVSAAGCDCSSGSEDEGLGGSGGGNGGDGADGGAPSSSSTGFGQGGDGAGTGAGGGMCGSNLTGALRDFQISHPDFEDFLGSDPGIVLATLGPDKKPVYAGSDGNPTTTNQANFDQWFRDTPGVNQTAAYTLELIDNGNGVFTFQDSDFFPVDDQLFGNEGNAHNYHFTFELHTTFLYQGGETFSFTGDDDLFTFINGQLAIDLGGVHGAQSQQIDLDASAATLGLTPGNIYPLDFFFAERHTSESNFRVDTSLVFIDCGEPPT